MSEAVTAIPAQVAAAPKADDAKKKLILRGVGAVAIVGALYFVYTSIFYVGTDNAQVQANTVILASRVSGFIDKVNVEEGQKVKAGEVLAHIDAKDYQSRIESLYKSGAVSLQQRDSALANYQELSRRTKALQASLDVTKNSLDDTSIRAPSDGVIAKKSAEIGMLASVGMPLFGFVSNDTRWVTANFKETDLNRLKVGQHVSIDVDAISGRTFEGEIESFNPSTGAVFSLLPPDNATGNFTKVVQRVPTRIKFNNLKAEDMDVLKAGLSAVVDVRVK
jgi:membrane fusion protein (multidrug efflux system)